MTWRLWVTVGETVEIVGDYRRLWEVGHEVVWCGEVWHGVVWHGVALCGVVWCGVVWRSATAIAT